MSLLQLSEEELKTLKMHCKVDISYEDDLLKMYYAWAVEDIISSVTHERPYNVMFFEDHTLFNQAIFPLVNYYYENRIAYTERKVDYAPNMVLSVIHKLRAEYIPISGDSDDV